MQTIEEIAQSEYSHHIAEERTKKKYFKHLFHKAEICSLELLTFVNIIATYRRLVAALKKCAKEDKKVIETLQKEIEARDIYISFLETRDA